MSEGMKAYVIWASHTLLLAGQAYLAYLAQTSPKWAWLMPVISVAQGTMPNPFKKP